MAYNVSKKAILIFRARSNVDMRFTGTCYSWSAFWGDANALPESIIDFFLFLATLRDYELRIIDGVVFTTKDWGAYISRRAQQLGDGLGICGENRRVAFANHRAILENIENRQCQMCFRTINIFAGKRTSFDSPAPSNTDCEKWEADHIVPVKLGGFFRNAEELANALH